MVENANCSPGGNRHREEERERGMIDLNPILYFSTSFQLKNTKDSSNGWFLANTTPSMKRLRADGVELQDAPGYSQMRHSSNGVLMEDFCGFMEYVRISH